MRPKAFTFQVGLQPQAASSPEERRGNKSTAMHYKTKSWFGSDLFFKTTTKNPLYFTEQRKLGWTELNCAGLHRPGLGRVVWQTLLSQHTLHCAELCLTVMCNHTVL